MTADRTRGALPDLLIFAVAVVLLVLTWKHNLLAAAAIVALFGLRALFRRKPGDLTLYAVGAILGPVTEVLATALGIWTYARPTLLGIPLWLPFAWGFAAVLFVRIAQGLLPDQR